MLLPTVAQDTTERTWSKPSTARASDTVPTGSGSAMPGALATRSTSAASAGSVLTSWQTLRRSGSLARSSVCSRATTLGALGSAIGTSSSAVSSMENDQGIQPGKASKKPTQ